MAARLLAAYDAQLRTEAEVVSAQRVVRMGPLWIGSWDGGHAVVTYRDLAGLDERAIRALVDRAVDAVCASPGITTVEWKTRAHDAAPGLEQALADAGFVPDPVESVMAGEASRLAVGARVPDGINLRRIRSEPDVRKMVAMQSVVFGDDRTLRVRELLDRLAEEPRTELWVAEAPAVGGTQMVSAGRLEPVAGTDFAGLWGGGTLPSWRGRGIYRALTAARARSALRDGKIYLNADCTDMSRPILERAGLLKISETTPWIWETASGDWRRAQALAHP